MQIQDILLLTTNFILALATAALVYVTWILAKEAKLTRKEQQRPNIIISLEPHKDHINFAELIIENIGYGPAYDLKVSFSCKVRSDNVIFNEMKLLNQNVLKPKSIIKTFAGRWDEIAPKQFETTLNYKNISQEYITEKFLIDTEQFNGLSTIGNNPLLEISKNTKKIADSISHVSSGFKKIKVETYNKIDREEETEWFKKQHSAQVKEDA